MSLLDILLIVPGAGFLIALLLPRDNPRLIRWFALSVTILEFVLSLLVIGPVLDNPNAFTCWYRRALDPVSGDPLSRRLERAQCLAGDPHHVPDSIHAHGELEHYHGARQGILRPSLVADVLRAGRLRGAGPVPVLRHVGDLTGADLLPDRRLGPRPAHLCGGQVLPLHHGRFCADAARDRLPVPEGEHVRHDDPREHAGKRAVDLYARRSVLAVPGLLPRFCGQGAAVPAAHLASRRARRSADGRLG